MDAKEYIRELVRMFDSLRDDCYKGITTCGGVDCKECPLKSPLICTMFLPESVDIVEKWSKEHPVKTIMDDFLEKYPNAELEGYGRPHVCAEKLGYMVECCHNCINCWNTPMEVE